MVVAQDNTPVVILGFKKKLHFHQEVKYKRIFCITLWPIQTELWTWVNSHNPNSLSAAVCNPLGLQVTGLRVLKTIPENMQSAFFILVYQTTHHFAWHSTCISTCHVQTGNAAKSLSLSTTDTPQREFQLFLNDKLNLVIAANLKFLSWLP